MAYHLAVLEVPCFSHPCLLLFCFLPVTDLGPASQNSEPWRILAISFLETRIRVSSSLPESTINRDKQYLTVSPNAFYYGMGSSTSQPCHSSCPGLKEYYYDNCLKILPSPAFGLYGPVSIVAGLAFLWLRIPQCLPPSSQHIPTLPLSSCAQPVSQAPSLAYVILPSLPSPFCPRDSLASSHMHSVILCEAPLVPSPLMLPIPPWGSRSRPC